MREVREQKSEGAESYRFQGDPHRSRIDQSGRGQPHFRKPGPSGNADLSRVECIHVLTAAATTRRIRFSKAQLETLGYWSIRKRVRNTARKAKLFTTAVEQ